MNRVGMYTIFVFFLIILLDSSLAADDRYLFQEETRRLEYYEMHEAITLPAIIKEGVNENKDYDKDRKKVEVDFLDEIISEIYQRTQTVSTGVEEHIPIFNSSQEELLKIYKQGLNRTAYLTFDDGPSETVTPQILDILKGEQIKATFFVVGKSARKNPQIIKRIYEEGHMLANHTYTHDYNIVYSSTDRLIDELNKTEALIQEILEMDYPLKLMRFPGGSFGEKSAFKRAVYEEGYLYIDWNSLNGDAEGFEMTVEGLMERFTSTAAIKAPLIILLHDTDAKSINVEVLPKMIKHLREGGYTFDSLMPRVGEANKIK